MITIGITGGIGSGKTTVCKCWESLGARIIYADTLAKELMVTDLELIKAIKKEFGENAYLEDGSLNRLFLSQQAFERNKVETLNRIVHPAVYKETETIKQIAEKEGVQVLVKEAALLLQNGRPDNFDYIVLVLADKEIRKERVAQRDHNSTDDVEMRITKQQDFSKLAHYADYIIENDGNLQDLLIKADEVYFKILSKEMS